MSQTTRWVTVARRSEGWEPQILTGDDIELTLLGGEVQLTRDRIFRGVSFEE